MQVEQALFTSARRATRQGYQLVARSRGVDNELARRLAKWGPTHGSLLDHRMTASCLSYFTTECGRQVVARTVYGGPEYSSRGALQIYTSMLALHPEQLAAYDQDPLRVASTAIILGLLRFRSPPLEGIGSAELPDSPPSAVATRDPSASPSIAALPAAIAALRSRQRVAILGVRNRLALLGELLSALPAADRAVTSFTTGLRPSQHRPFQLYLLPQVDADLRSRLVADQVQVLDSSQRETPRWYKSETV